MQYKILQVDLNSSHFFSILFGFQTFFEFPSGILKETLNPSSGLNSFYSAPFELKSKKTQPNSKASNFPLTTVDFVGWRQEQQHPTFRDSSQSDQSSPTTHIF